MAGKCTGLETRLAPHGTNGRIFVMAPVVIGIYVGGSKQKHHSVANLPKAATESNA